MNDEEKTMIRSAWMDPGSKSAKDQHNQGGQAFLGGLGSVPAAEEVVWRRRGRVHDRTYIHNRLRCRRGYDGARDRRDARSGVCGRRYWTKRRREPLRGPGGSRLDPCRSGLHGPGLV
jgi:hypothetical protein